MNNLLCNKSELTEKPPSNNHIKLGNSDNFTFDFFISFVSHVVRLVSCFIFIVSFGRRLYTYSSHIKHPYEVCSQETIIIQSYYLRSLFVSKKMQHKDHKNQSQYWIENRERYRLLFFFVAPISRKQSNHSRQQQQQKHTNRRARDRPANTIEWLNLNIPHSKSK